MVEGEGQSTVGAGSDDSKQAQVPGRWGDPVGWSTHRQDGDVYRYCPARKAGISGYACFALVVHRKRNSKSCAETEIFEIFD